VTDSPVLAAHGLVVRYRDLEAVRGVELASTAARWSV